MPRLPHRLRRRRKQCSRHHLSLRLSLIHICWMPVPGGFYVVPVLILLAGLVALFNPTGVRSTAFIIIGISSLVYACLLYTSTPMATKCFLFIVCSFLFLNEYSFLLHL